LRDIERRNYAGIGRALGLHIEDVVEYHKMLQKLEPWPGRPFSRGEDHYVTPDIYVFKFGDEWQVVLNEDGLPKLRVSPYYLQMLRKGKAAKKDEREYIKNKLDAADFLIKSIYRRQKTIVLVMECILRRQRDFFDEGVDALRPMILRDVADEIDVSESTVSRVTTNKYVQCPAGLFELKYFFNSRIQRANAEDVASEAVRNKIKQFIAEENSRKPLSDQAIANLLAEADFKVARRTVAKYREAMGILPSPQRKQLF
jgi:RNA polymerase sigma-54 factor